MSTVAYFHLITLLLNHVLWVYIFSKHPRNKVTLSYFFLLTAYASSLITQFILYAATSDAPWLLTLQKINLISWMFIGPLFYHLILSILSLKSRNTFWIYLTLSIYLSALTLTTPIMMNEVEFLSWGVTPKITLLLLLGIGVTLIIPIGHAFFLLLKAIYNPKYKPLSILLKYILGGSCIAYLIPLINDFILPITLGHQVWPSMGCATSLIQTICIFLVTRHGGFGGVGTYNAVDFVFKNVDDCLFLLDEFGRFVKVNIAAQKKFTLKPNHHLHQTKFIDIFESQEYESSRVYTGEIIQFQVQGQLLEFYVHQAPIKQWENFLGQIIIMKPALETSSENL